MTVQINFIWEKTVTKTLSNTARLHHVINDQCQHTVLVTLILEEAMTGLLKGKPSVLN